MTKFPDRSGFEDFIRLEGASLSPEEDVDEDCIILPFKSAWGDGLWQREPDEKDFVHAGFSCRLQRGPGGEWTCYLGVPEGHPWWKVSAFLLNTFDAISDPAWDISWSDNRYPGQVEHTNLWWVGFGMEGFQPAFAGIGTYKSLTIAAGVLRKFAERAQKGRE